MEKKLLILGPTGNIGIPLINQLKAKGTEFILGLHSHSTNGIEENDLEGFDSVGLDYNDVESLNHAMNGVKCVFILIPDSPQIVEHLKNIYTAMKANSVSQFVFLSGLGVKVAPETWLSQQLIDCESILKNSGLSGVIVRPGFFMQNFIHHYPPQPDNTISMPIGDAKVNYIDTRDVAFFCSSLLVQDQKHQGFITYDLTGKSSLSLYEIADIFTHIMGRKYTYIQISIEQAKKQMEYNQLPAWRTNMLEGIYERVRLNAYDFHSDNFQKVTGNQPSEFSRFIESYRRYFEKISMSALSQ